MQILGSCIIRPLPVRTDDIEAGSQNTSFGRQTGDFPQA